jgi:hypothetical protein
MSQMSDGGGGLRIRSPQDMGAGIFMILLGLLAFVLGYELPLGTLRSMGPGMLPKSFAVICMGLGFLMCLNAFRWDGPALEGWSTKGVLLVLGGACLFGMAIRGFDVGPISVPSLGLLVAGPLVVLVSGLAADDMKWKEILIFAGSMTVACAILFKYLLGLPIPLAPWLLGV